MIRDPFGVELLVHFDYFRQEIPMPSRTSKSIFLPSLLLVVSLLLSACQPKVGSDAWCDWMEEKPKGDWTANEAKDYATHCIIKIKD